MFFRRPSQDREERRTISKMYLCVSQFSLISSAHISVVPEKTKKDVLELKGIDDITTSVMV